ncbi:MAG TPA: metal-dependent hydrolase [candidate division Zixibacteria bacterium]|nr:metal-dependent hydrolase [candidate division Zixibacteria bacterium]
MFIGHFGVAFAAKRAAPDVNLGVLFAAAQLIDLVWPLLLLAGVERVRIAPGDTAFTPLEFTHYPYTHSLLTVALWAALAGGAYWLWRRRGRAAVVVALLVASHWLLDWLTHRPDLPLYPGSDKVAGLGLWDSIVGSLAVEGAIFAAGLALYLQVTAARSRVGVWAVWSLVVFLIVTYLGAAFGPPPPDVAALAWSALLVWLFPLWGYWAERHRSPRV